MSGFVKAPEQPLVTDLNLADGIFAKHILIQKAGTWVPQHSHAWEHISLVSAGIIEVYQDAVFIGVFKAPRGIVIPAGTMHTFRTLVDNTVISCIHRVDRTGGVEVVEEHEIVGT